MNYDSAMICANCLETGAARVEVGPDIGTQRDPERRKVILCEPCCDALLAAQFDTLTNRFTTERTLRRT